MNGCRTALDRAYRAANFLRTGERATHLHCGRQRQPRGMLWAGSPSRARMILLHRPVNVPSSDFPQYDFQVPIERPFWGPTVDVSVHTRYTIAQLQDSDGLSC